MKKVFRLIAHLIFGIRKYNDNCIKNYAKQIDNKKVLELGSGKHTFGENYYSAKRYFNDTNTFIQSDINPDFGHIVIDATTMTDVDEYDVILCMNVLEHVYDYQLAIDNLYRALKPGGQLTVFVPQFYPLHDEPHDYWRFSEHALRKMFGQFKSVDIKHKGLRQFPVAYFVILDK